MNDIEVYKERMDICMTEEEKLFFVKHLDFSHISTIIDFGGANGSLLWHLVQLRPEVTFTQKYIVDNNPQMQIEYPLENTVHVDDITKVVPDKSGKVLIIFSSVLHECTAMETVVLSTFCRAHTDIVVIRDMFYHGGHHPTVSLFEDFAAYEIIRNKPEWYAMFEDLRQKGQNVWMQSAEEILTHFVLKYTYLENWESECKENYFSNNAGAVSESLLSDGWSYLFKRNYVLPYKAKQASDVFSWSNLPDTHTQRILIRS